MPLNINVGLSRKASKDYQSTGYSINVTAELDQSLLARPDELQVQIAALYAHAHEALDNQVAQGPAAGRQGTISQPGERQRSASPVPATRPARNNGSPAPATSSQQRAIVSICNRLNLDPDSEAGQLFGAVLADLSVKQASQLIDHLKAVQPTEPGRNGGGR